MTRRLVREEGIFCGASCGSAVAGAIKYAHDQKLGKEDVVVVILPDSGSRYFSKAFDDEWLRENGFLEQTWVDFRPCRHSGRQTVPMRLSPPSPLI